MADYNSLETTAVGFKNNKDLIFNNVGLLMGKFILSYQLFIDFQLLIALYIYCISISQLKVVSKIMFLQSQHYPFKTTNCSYFQNSDEAVTYNIHP